MTFQCLRNPTVLYQLHKWLKSSEWDPSICLDMMDYHSGGLFLCRIHQRWLISKEKWSIDRGCHRLWASTMTGERISPRAAALIRFKRDLPGFPLSSSRRGGVSPRFLSSSSSWFTSVSFSRPYGGDGDGLWRYHPTAPPRNDRARARARSCRGSGSNPRTLESSPTFFTEL